MSQVALSYTPPKCGCGNQVYTTICQIPACKECSEKYETEGRSGQTARPFFAEFLRKAREAGHRAATDYVYQGVDV